jgi:3-oxoacyl-(acyl-carrier-protein) synthase
MMSPIYAVSTGLSENSSLNKTGPEFRKATRNMILAHAALDEALSPFFEKTKKPCLEDFGLVLGTSRGELDVTMRFLTGLAEKKVASPLLFQNSLHNSTAGFLSLYWKLSAPAITVSNSYFTGEDALDLGALMIQEQQCRFCIVAAVDSTPPELLPGLQYSGLPQSAWGEGAAAVILGDQEACLSIGTEPLAELTDVRSIRNGSKIGIQHRAESDFQNFYDSNGLELWVKALRRSSSSPLRGERTSLVSIKPDGGESIIEWTNG